ncbi:MAG: hypothetical protein M1586_00895 [Patescibacteria group bacterium]|nr:hypothetical protein [Patescibacteria group bacterium]MCL5261843.1 hypothetical protein [Patescibacteria group bacterium]
MGTGALAPEFYRSGCLCGFSEISFELGYAERLPNAKASVDTLRADLPSAAPALYRIEAIEPAAEAIKVKLRKELFFPRDRIDVGDFGFRIGGLVVLCRECRGRAMRQSPQNTVDTMTVRVVVSHNDDRTFVKLAA